MKTWIHTRSCIATALVGAFALTAAISQAASPRASKGDAIGPAPRLVLQITVDHLRGDLPGRYVKNMGDGGFRYLMDQGIWYADAHHAHANTETIVGHTTLATGADPSAHGMIGNLWLNRATGKPTYNIEDPNYRLISPGSDVNKATEIDPTQKVASTGGRSPAAILVSTFSDELAIRTAGRAKIFGVSIKDRGAVGALTANRVSRSIETVDIAPTLAAIVGAKPPSGSRSGPLQEVLQGSAH